ncbi:TPM domain-containing protein [Hymenobacter fodinae]|uniref:TPM domain-containing protein n=1 Tax=Hymenobacter fodinae TaxID=2510796 RepID=A0A4Z0PB77_9BACT|nr:TPM domain-containing protein [Hymenobacter fodinae]TGE09471.1 TPM domain-containing protein [Hymenobacter fodinae]
MVRILLFFLLLAAGMGRPAAAVAQELPPRPAPFRFVNDQAQLMSPADAKTLENGLRRYADKTGNQLVVVTVPTLGGRDVADYGRALGLAWGVGQRDKNNGVVVLLGAQEHKVTIQAGSGLRTQITPELTARVINQQMTPSFKQGNYFAGLRSGLNALMLAADPNANQPAAATPAPATDNTAGVAASGAGLSDELPARASAPDPVSAPIPASDPGSPGLGMGTLLLGALVIGGGLWLIIRMFRRKSAPATNPYATPTNGGGAPDFLPNQPNGPAGNYGRGMGGQQPQGGPDFLPNRGNSGGGGGLGSGMGGILATGAAAAAGAYLGNRMAHGHDTPNAAGYDVDRTPPPLDTNTGAAAGAGAYTGGGFPALGGTSGTDDTAPDYFSETTSDDSQDYFSSDYDDTSSDDTGGGGFDDDNNNSGEW